MSSILNAEDLNDFIRPSVACIKPVEIKNDNSKSNHIELEFEDANSANGEGDDDVAVPKKLVKAEISLNDCLACSGCITSSEEVLLEQHNYKKFTDFMTGKDPKMQVIVSLSQQSRASLANTYEMDIKDMDRLLFKIFEREWGVKYFVSVNISRKLIYEEIVKEVKQRQNAVEEGNARPLLGSMCPGWVLYVEKTVGELVKDLSCVASAQEITGRLIKKLMGDNIYHLSVMPCFDKKLEASRGDSVDCVITPREVVLMLRDRGIELGQELLEDEDYQEFVKRVSPDGWFDGGGNGWLANSEGQIGGSGGYAEGFLRNWLDGARGEIVVEGGRNRDVYELQLVVEGEVICRAGVVNGFKNIQNLVRKIRGGRSSGDGSGRRVIRRRGGDANTLAGRGKEIDFNKWSFVEVMACPGGGCVNGGGQLQGENGAGADNNHVDDVYGGTVVEEPVVETQSARWVKQQVGDVHWDFSIVGGARTGARTGAETTDATETSEMLGAQW